MEGFLRVDNVADLTRSPTNSFAADEITSICPLLTPSPTSNALDQLPQESNYTGEELTDMLHHAQEDNDEMKSVATSASSSSSALAEPACAQLLTHRTSHLHEEQPTDEKEEPGKNQMFSHLTFRNPPDNYIFMSWNWPLIRKISLWMFISALVVMVASVIAMISSLPKSCNPHTEWYQGGVFYEVFPASFADSDNDMVGDFKGMWQNAEYISNLGIRAVRLNSIFKTPHYPEDYRDVSTLRDIAPQLGNLTNFKILIQHFHSKNISLVLDIPIWPVVKELPSEEDDSTNFTHSVDIDYVEEALDYWSHFGIDGFYLKGLENLVNDPHFVPSLRRWRKTIGFDRIFIVNESLVDSASPALQKIILSNVNLVDIRLQLEKGVTQVTKQIESIQNGTLFSTRHMPWIHWSLGDDTSHRLANLLPYNATVGATLLQLMLPGTPSIFYGNEIGLQQMPVVEHEDARDFQHLNHLGSMVLPNKPQQVLPWMQGKKSHPNFSQAEMIAKLIKLRAESPAIYINSVYNKEKEYKANAEVKYSKNNMVVIQRWYPRRKSYVIVSNFGGSNLTTDLSKLLYGGEVVIGPKTDSESSSISFKDVSLWPGESVVVLLS